MDALIILLVGYVILKSIFSGGDDYDKKPKHRKEERNHPFGVIPYVFRLRHVEPIAWG